MKPRLLVVLAFTALATTACGSSDVDTASATTAPTITPAVTAPTAITPEEALGIADAYFEAYNAGDTDAVLALMTPEGTFADNFGSQTRSAWEQLLAWNAAQGTQLDAVECSVAREDEDGASVTVTCVFENRDAVVQAVQGPPVPVTQTMSITPDGISEWEFSFGQPDFNTVWTPFRDWLSANHPEDAGSVGFGNWSSVQEAAQNGLLTAQSAEAWRTYLVQHGCTYSDDS